MSTLTSILASKVNLLHSISQIDSLIVIAALILLAI